VPGLSRPAGPPGGSTSSLPTASIEMFGVSMLRSYGAIAEHTSVKGRSARPRPTQPARRVVPPLRP
jgi:hypothetical protein